MKMFYSVYYIISIPSAAERCCLPQLGLEPATFELLDRRSTN